MADTIQLRLTEVHCNDETGGGLSEWGDDDIYLGGISVARDSSGQAQVNKIPYFKVGDFNDGVRKRFDPPRVFAEMPATSSSSHVIFVLVEKDSGDQMGPFLDNLVLQAMSELKADGEQGEGDGQQESALEFWKEVGEAAYAIYKHISKDDIFPLQPVAFQGLPDGTPEGVGIKGNKASYDISYDWHWA